MEVNRKYAQDILESKVGLGTRFIVALPVLERGDEVDV